MTPTSVVKPDKGRVVYVDDFSQAASGWDTTNGRSYVSGGYQFTVPSTYVRYSPSPYDVPVAQVALSVTATVTTGSNGGFGVVCEADSSSSQGIDYEFLVWRDATWQIGRRNQDSPKYPTPLASGQSPARPGSTPVTVEGACVSFPGSKAVRLLLYINGHRAADLTDDPGVPLSAEWFRGVMGAGQVTFVATNFTERDLDS